MVNQQVASLVNNVKRAMVCTANDLLEWKDFPKGLRVLLLDEDRDSASEIKSKLEEMEYIVSAFFSEHEALSAISSKNKSFHVAIVEVNTHNNDGRYKFLESAKDLPTIMTSKEHCLSTMMKCIALGAVEFLIKPLSEDKLRNIWQHVVHKAFNAGRNGSPESLNSIGEFVGSILEIQQQNIASYNQIPDEPQNDSDQSKISDKFPAPSTPQLKQGGRIFDDGDCQDQTAISSPVRESREVESETKSVDNTITYGDSVAKMEIDSPRPTAEMAIKTEEDCSDGSKGTDNSSSKPHDGNKEDDTNLGSNTGNSNEVSTGPNVRGAKSDRRKFKVDWTPDLHKKFVQAVEKLGVDQAIPSRILELMKVEGLTRHNIASHLQKYRMHRRNILPKDDTRRWPHPRDSIQRNYYPYRPVMAFPPYQTNHTLPHGQVYTMWGQQGGQPPHLPVWSPPPSYPWQPVESWHWKPYPPMHADAWGCPVLPPSPCPPSTFPLVQGAFGFQSPNHYGKNSADLHPEEEVIDKVVREAISKPWLPLPIGLKPPSTDSVLAELSRQGISAVPPHINGHHPC